MTRARENADLPVAMTESGGQVGIGAAPAKSLDVNMASATMRIRDASGGNDFSVKTVKGPFVGRVYGQHCHWLHDE